MVETGIVYILLAWWIWDHNPSFFTIGK